MKKLLIALLLLGNTVQAQTLLEHTFNHNINFGITDVLDIGNGELMFTAIASPPTLDSAMALVMKTDTAFNIQWIKRYKAFARDDFSKIKQSSDGNFLVGGVMKQQFGTQSGSSLYKMSPQGNVLWHNVYSRTADDRVLEIFEQTDGSLMVFVRHGVTNQPTKILHTDSVGNLLSQRVYKVGSDGVFADDVTSEGNGIYYMGGLWRNAPNNFYGFFISAVDESGLQWYKKYTLPRSSFIYTLDFMTDGFMVASGYMRDTTVLLNYHPVVIKFDPQGNVVWANEYRETLGNSSNMYRAFPAANGDILLSGYVMDGVNRNGLLTKLDANGDLLWSKRYSNFPFHSIGEVKTLNDGRLLLTSNANNAPYMLIASSDGLSACSSDSLAFSSSMIIVSDTSITPSVVDPMVIQNIPNIIIGTTLLTDSALCASAVGIEDKFNEPEITIFPNPSDQYLNVSISTGSIRGFDLRIYDMLGNEVVSKFTSYQDDIILDISSLSTGMYVLSIATDSNYIQRKFIKQ